MRITFGLLIGIIVCFISTDAAASNEFYKNNNLTNEPMFEMKDKKPSNEQTVYMSELLMDKYPETCKNLIAILDELIFCVFINKGRKGE